MMPTSGKGKPLAIFARLFTAPDPSPNFLTFARPIPLKHSILKQLGSPAGLMQVFAYLFVLSMMLSPFLLSISMWGLVAAALWQSGETYRRQHPGAANAWAGGLLDSFRRFFRQPVSVALSLLLLAPALSYFWSYNTTFWASQTRIRIPFFVLSWAFANLPLLTARQYKSVLYVLVWNMVILCIGVGINLLLNYDAIIDALNHGRPVPAPRNHIRFNLLLATAILVGGWLWQQRFVWRYAWERRLLGVAVLFMFAFIHILSVRSGLVALYSALLFTVGYVIVRTGRWQLGVAALGLVAAAPFVAYKTMPSLRQRISYMVYDWEKYRQNDGGEYSDSQRWVSLEIGVRLWKQHPVLGIGAGDLPMEVQRVANDHFPSYSIEPRLPHNQFLYILTGTGLLGLAMSVIAWLAPFTLQSARRFYLFLVFQVMIFVSFLVEYTLETAIGVAYYLFFTLWFVQMGKIIMNDE